MDRIINNINNKTLKGTIKVPGDKSISHRAVMLGSLAEGTTRITGFLSGADCLSTIGCFRKMGIDIRMNDPVSNDPVSASDASSKTPSGTEVIVTGKGLHGLKDPMGTLDTGNSGTTTRLISGILSGQSFSSRLSGDASLNSRPMKRIMTPLSCMGADIKSENDNGCCPLLIRPAKLKGIDYISPISSAQVKSAVLLAGMYADGETKVTEPVLSRDHTERMIRMFGGYVKSFSAETEDQEKNNSNKRSSSGPLTSKRHSALILPEPRLTGTDILVPGDISSAAYFIAAALLVPGSEILIQNVGINKTRAGILKVVEMMGGKLEYLNEKNTEDQMDGEPVADILVKSSSLNGCEISGEIIPTLIDEIPMIAVMAAFANGKTVIRDAAELKVKETDRIMTVTQNLKKMGCDITPTDDGMIINGGNALHGAELLSYDDHRIAMSFTVAGLVAEGTTKIKDSECVSISYPSFFNDIESLIR